MRITRAAEYAVRCMVYMSTKGTGVLISRREIADNADIPPHFLAKIAQDLAKAGFIQIRQGAKGGFVLVMEPKKISLLEVVETIIGEIHLNDCVGRPDSCDFMADCAVHDVWTKARDELRKTLGAVNFAELTASGD